MSRFCARSLTGHSVDEQYVTPGGSGAPEQHMSPPQQPPGDAVHDTPSGAQSVGQQSVHAGSWQRPYRSQQTSSSGQACVASQVGSGPVHST